MADNHVLVLRSGPGTSQADGALGLAQALLAQNGSVVIALLQDAVLATLSNGDLPAHRRLRSLLEAGARCVYLAEDLALHGFGSDQTRPGCSPTDYDGLVDLLLADSARVAGGF
jgi:sulfur transfer complex TusBCD TusB component (DsrH family)